jgi:threonine dehydratase
MTTYDDVQRAAIQIAPLAFRTPVLTSDRIDDLVGARIVFKCENFQRVGAFKFRGAYNALSRFSDEQRRAGVVGYSSGNHAQALALAARMLDIPATIVMPKDAASSKVTATQEYGGNVVWYDRYTEDREAIAAALAAQHGLTMIPPFDHPDVLAGQGTAAKELFEDAGDLDALFVPLGGGGLLAGTALAASVLAPQCRLFGVEPQAGDDGVRSMREGRIVTIDQPTTIADGAATRHLGHLTFEIIRRFVENVVTVTDDQLIEAMRLHAGLMKLVVEPTGALGLAGVRAHVKSLELRGARIGVIISGGNVDLDRFAEMIK